MKGWKGWCIKHAILYPNVASAVKPAGQLEPSQVVTIQHVQHSRNGLVRKSPVSRCKGHCCLPDMGVTSPSSGSEIYASCDLQKGNRPLPHRSEREIERDLAAARTILDGHQRKSPLCSPPSNITRIILQYRREKPGLDLFPFSSAAVL